MTQTDKAADSSRGAALPKYRAANPAAIYGVTRGVLREGQGGVQYLTCDTALPHYAHRMNDRLVHWAAIAPERTFMAQRERLPDGSRGDWVRLSYSQFLARARAIAQALLQYGLSEERPVAILAENSLDHALVAFGCLLIGVPHCPVSTPYALVSKDYEKLRHVMQTLTPGLVFAADARFGPAIAATVPPEVPVVMGSGALEGRATRPLAELLATHATHAVDDAMAQVHPGTITKFLFTSGSTKNPKAVINTHRMWCANQQQLRCSLPPVSARLEDGCGPVLVDWLPWNHTFGGNHNIGIVLNNGGTLYIDEGKPTPAGIGETLRNLREIGPTIYFNVPTGFEAIADAMEQDAQLRRKLLERCQLFYYAGAALPPGVLDKLYRIAEAEVGERIVMGTGLGMTESSPFALNVTRPDMVAGELGLPAAGLELKLVPSDGKTEIRYRGPNVTPGYWRMPEATHESFDEEGFFLTGDAVRWIDPDNLHLGLRFDGRIAEDFKLTTGTFVSVGPLRAKVTAFGAPYVQDVVLTGLNMKEVGALIFPTQAVRELAQLPAHTPLAEVLQSAAVQAHFQTVVDRLAADATGSANRIARAVLVAEPPSIDKGEVTDKGSINQRAVLKHRDAFVQALHGDGLPFTLKPQWN
ncbi:feruloyl-CoA synthase [Xenophilus arseniciresistens]|uniref:Feruloyl-CoA synthase n=1 Tax=Xenophilus arseniciresistens TaxID=1283306 RepID=A0AAE3SXY6_9BURK|nr:feruloyl-CoA synthase [Xenophilus arseniciresistens]MDA7415444.1 feruloyl-CoA synthase [Xenophilus arseniciresistens]